jgi:hypothetical protein
MKDTTNADLTIKATGYQWKWGYDYLKGEGEGIGFLSTLDASHRAMSDAGKARGRQLPAQGGQPAGGAGGQEGPHHHHRQRRDPRLDGAGLRRQAGRHPRLRARHLVPRREDRRLLRPVRRAVRQGARLHADPREGAERSRTTAWVEGKKKKMAAKADDPNKVWTLDEIWWRAARRSMPPTARPATRPTARAPARSSRWTARRGAGRRQEPSRSPSCSTARTTARCRPGSSCRHRDRRGDHLHQEQLVQQDGQLVQPAESWPRASDAPHPRETDPQEGNQTMSAVLDHHGHAARRPPRPPMPPRLAALGVRHEPQGHRHAVPAVLVHHADVRRRAGAAASAPSCSSPACRSSTPSCSTSSPPCTA